MNLVLQQDDFTCGVACAAMVADVSFKEALRVSDRREKGMSSRGLETTLKRLGVRFERLVYPEIHRTLRHILVVPSLNVVAGLHYVAVDMEGGLFNVYDPQWHRPGKLYYAKNCNDSDGIQLGGYSEVTCILPRASPLTNPPPIL